MASLRPILPYESPLRRISHICRSRVENSRLRPRRGRPDIQTSSNLKNLDISSQMPLTSALPSLAAAGSWIFAIASGVISEAAVRWSRPSSVSQSCWETSSVVSLLRFVHSLSPSARRRSNSSMPPSFPGSIGRCCTVMRSYFMGTPRLQTFDAVTTKMVRRHFPPVFLALAAKLIGFWGSQEFLAKPNPLPVARLITRSNSWHHLFARPFSSLPQNKGAGRSSPALAGFNITAGRPHHVDPRTKLVRSNYLVTQFDLVKDRATGLHRTFSPSRAFALYSPC